MRVVEALERGYRMPTGVEIIDGGTSSMEMLEALSHLDLLVVIDAINDGKPPGTLIELIGAEVPVFFRRHLSPHGIGLPDVLAALEFIGAAPTETIVLGAQPLSLDLGTELTPTLAARVPALVARTVDVLAQHGLAPQPC